MSCCERTPHWTDTHIKVIDDLWVAYDEAGMEHGRYTSENEARDALVVYNAVYLSEAGQRHDAHVRAEAIEQAGNDLYDAQGLDAGALLFLKTRADDLRRQARGEAP